MELRFYVFFFFKQKTAYEMRISDWSSDVCSSDLGGGDAALRGGHGLERAVRDEADHGWADGADIGNRRSLDIRPAVGACRRRPRDRDLVERRAARPPPRTRSGRDDQLPGDGGFGGPGATADRRPRARHGGRGRGG